MSSKLEEVPVQSLCTELSPIFRANSHLIHILVPHSVELSPHGREQESSSEAIAAFEGIALYGNVMASDVSSVDCEKLLRINILNITPTPLMRRWTFLPGIKKK